MAMPPPGSGTGDAVTSSCLPVRVMCWIMLACFFVASTSRVAERSTMPSATMQATSLPT